MADARSSKDEAVVAKENVGGCFTTTELTPDEAEALARDKFAASVSASSKTGLLASFFSSRKVGLDGRPMFKEGFVDDKYHGDGGLYRWAVGAEDTHGVGISCLADGAVAYSTHEMGKAMGEGLCWSADCRTAHRTADCANKMLILHKEAKDFAMEKFGQMVPEPRGFIGKLFPRHKVV